MPLLSLPAPSLIRTKYPFTAGSTERVFQLSHGEARSRIHNLTATFCTIIELLSTRPRRLSVFFRSYPKCSKLSEKLIILKISNIVNNNLDIYLRINTYPCI